MGRINSGINATSGGAPLGSAVYFVCRHMLYGHCYLPIHFPLLDAQNKQILTPPPVGAASPPDSGWGLRHTLPPPERPHPQSPCSQGITRDPAPAPR